MSITTHYRINLALSHRISQNQVVTRIWTYKVRSGMQYAVTMQLRAAPYDPSWRRTLSLLSANNLRDKITSKWQPTMSMSWPLWHAMMQRLWEVAHCHCLAVCMLSLPVSSAEGIRALTQPSAQTAHCIRVTGVTDLSDFHCLTSLLIKTLHLAAWEWLRWWSVAAGQSRWGCQSWSGTDG